MNRIKTMTKLRSYRPALILLALALAPLAVNGQVTLDDGKVQIHSFFDEGYIKSDGNNFLTMNTNAGSALMAEGGVNVSWQASDNLRFSAQGYDHYIGRLGEGQLQLDFALVDYKAKDWLAFRAGKVKTQLGLFTDTQDQTFAYTFALLPQSVYPADLRSMTIAHEGGDIYGRIKLSKRNAISYDVYAGMIPDDPRGGYTYGIEQQGVKFNGGITATPKALTFAGQLRWMACSSAHHSLTTSGTSKDILRAYSRRAIRLLSIMYLLTTVSTLMAVSGSIASTGVPCETGILAASKRLSSTTPLRTAGLSPALIVFRSGWKSAVTIATTPFLKSRSRRLRLPGLDRARTSSTIRR